MNIETKPIRRHGKKHLGDGLSIWRKVRAHFDWPELPYIFDFVIGLDGDRMVVESFTVGRRPDGPPVTGEALRSVQVAAFLRYAARNEVELDEEATALAQRKPAELKANGQSDEALAAVSLAYRLAYLCGESPRQAVVDALDVSRATATRWITAAVERDFLDAGLARRASEES